MFETKCEYCDAEVILPFECNFCRGHFCVEHRLPENHACPEYWRATLPRPRLPEYFPSIQQRRTRVFFFSPTELRHIALSVLLVMGVGLSFSWEPYLLFQGQLPDLEISLILAIVFTSVFIIHEIAHKLVAQHYGLWAEFRLTTWGAVLTLASIIFPIKIISPGAMMIAGPMNRRTVGRTAFAGPFTNILFSAVFLLVLFSVSQQSLLAYIAFIEVAINAWIAILNLIPFGILDGRKIFGWNKAVWALAFATSSGLTIFSFLYMG